MTEIIDVTLREGGEATGFQLSADDAVSLAEAIAVTGVDCIEIGYFRPREWSAARTARSSSPAYIRAIRDVVGGTRLSVFAHLSEIPPGALAPLPDLGVDMLRIAVHPDRPGPLLERASELRQSGLMFSVNAVRISMHASERIIALGKLAEELGAGMFYVADSNGSLYPKQFVMLAEELRAALSIPIGAHLHDNLALAMANALVALEHGFDWLDGTLAGVGKGGGNLSTERIALHLQVAKGRKFALKCLADLSQGWAWARPSPTAAFWSAVHGELNMNQQQVAELNTRPDAERLRCIETEFGLPLNL